MGGGEKVTDVESKSRRVIPDDEELFPDNSSDSSSDDDAKDAPWRLKTTSKATNPKTKDESSSQTKKPSEAIPKVFMKKKDTDISTSSSKNKTSTAKSLTNKTANKSETTQKSIPKKTSMQ